MRQSATLVSCLAGLSILFSAAISQPQDPPSQTTPPPSPRQGGNALAQFDFAKGLKETPGCLGVDAGRFQSGKQSIFAWFENKEAVVRWYKSQMHRDAMRTLSPTLGGAAPLKWVDDDEGPILVIATITLADRPHFEEMPELPISQISIELFKPLPGGAHLGGRLSPESFKVEHMSALAEGG